MPLQPGDKLGPYEILDLIGKGGMGEVYRAHDTNLSRDVAIKVLPAALAQDPDRLARFEREAKVLAAMSHPNIAIIHGLENTADSRAIVMELVEGPTLEDRLKKAGQENGALRLKETLAIARQIADALEAAHEKGVVHRDLKPANIKVREDGTVKVLDFGLATAVLSGVREPGRAADSPTLTLRATQAGMILGTAAYMAPEQAEGKPVDRRADIWSFGVVLWEMVTGQRLFHADTVPMTLADVLRKPLEFTQIPASTPAPVRDLLRRCLDRDVKTRLRDIGEARVAIQRVLANPDSETERPRQASAAPPTSRLSRLWPAVAAVLLLALGGLAFVHFREAPPAEHTLRSTITAPENSVVSYFTLSPDGRNLVIAARVNGKQQLWLRPMDAFEAQPMPFTEDAVLPFWSPDSRTIGFFTPGKLKRVEVTGGPAQTICDTGSAARGGSWSRDGVIVFSSGQSGAASAIQRVPAGGGVPVNVSKTTGTYRYPEFLPDGRHFLYLSIQAPADKVGIYLISLDGSENSRILPDESGVVFASGHLLFIRDNTLMAQPFDPKQGRLLGDAAPVAEGVSTGNLTYAPVSVSENGILIYERGALSVFLAQTLVWHDRTGKVLGQLGLTGGGPSISPDEKTVAFSHATGPRLIDLWLWDLARQTPTRFSAGRANFVPVWSPKGDRIAFTRFGSGPDGYQLIQRAANGSLREDLLLPSTNLLSASNHWSSDGHFIVYSQVGPNSKLGLWILPMNDGPMDDGDHKPVPFLQTEFNELQGQFSPDSHWMAYTSDESGAFEIYVRPFPSVEGMVNKVSTAGGYQPRWRADGRELFYVAADGKMTAVSVRAGAGPKPSLVLGTPEPLFDSHIEIQPLTAISAPVPFFDYDVTADGRFLVATAAATSAPALNVEVNWTARLKK